MIFDFSDPLNPGIGSPGNLFLFEWAAGQYAPPPPGTGIRMLALLGVGS